MFAARRPFPLRLTSVLVLVGAAMCASCQSQCARGGYGCSTVAAYDGGAEFLVPDYEAAVADDGVPADADPVAEQRDAAEK